jgi:crossover junction endodeoxyribonuclease RuvC
LRILGVDPGLRVTGYGVIEITERYFADRRIDLIEAGMIRTDAKSGIGDRLKNVHQSLSDVISENKPDVLAIEKLYAHYEHPATAILMGHVRGVVCLLSDKKHLPLVNIASTHVKKAICGHGHAPKQQIQKMVQTYLNLKKTPEPADVADALAIAITYVFSIRNTGAFLKNNPKVMAYDLEN